VIMSKYDIKIEKSGGNYKVHVAGVLDEDTDFSPHSLAGSAQIEMHLKDVKGINSCGIREWIKWIGTAEKAQVTYFECPKIIVDQINMVQGFLPSGGKVMSFFVPYYCDDSGEEKNILFSHGKEYTDTTVTSPASVKDSAGNDMEIDVVEAKYFKFIQK
jgi:hypothetical protein